MTTIVTIDVPDQPVKVLIREVFPDGSSHVEHTLERNDRTTVAVWKGRTIQIEEVDAD